MEKIKKMIVGIAIMLLGIAFEIFAFSGNAGSSGTTAVFLIGCALIIIGLCKVIINSSRE